MLTRREVEAQLRSLHPMRQQSRRRLHALSSRRRYAEITVAVLLGLALIGAFGSGRMSSASNPQVVARQSATWGVEHVRSWHARPPAPLFPSVRRRRPDTVNPFARGAQASRPGAARGNPSGY